jgi:hypothetical protein
MENVDREDAKALLQWCEERSDRAVDDAVTAISGEEARDATNLDAWCEGKQAGEKPGQSRRSKRRAAKTYKRERIATANQNSLQASPSSAAASVSAASTTSPCARASSQVSSSPYPDLRNVKEAADSEERRPDVDSAGSPQNMIDTGRALWDKIKTFDEDGSDSERADLYNALGDVQMTLGNRAAAEECYRVGTFNHAKGALIGCSDASRPYLFSRMAAAYTAMKAAS